MCASQSAQRKEAPEGNVNVHMQGEAECAHSAHAASSPLPPGSRRPFSGCYTSLSPSMAPARLLSMKRYSGAFNSLLLHL